MVTFDQLAEYLQGVALDPHGRAMMRVGNHKIGDGACGHIDVPADSVLCTGSSKFVRVIDSVLSTGEVALEAAERGATARPPGVIGGVHVVLAAGVREVAPDIQGDELYDGDFEFGSNEPTRATTCT